jgi:hypothetical protein
MPPSERRPQPRQPEEAATETPPNVRENEAFPSDDDDGLLDLIDGLLEETASLDDSED